MKENLKKYYKKSEPAPKSMPKNFASGSKPKTKFQFGDEVLAWMYEGQRKMKAIYISRKYDGFHFKHLVFIKDKEAMIPARYCELDPESENHEFGSIVEGSDNKIEWKMGTYYGYLKTLESTRHLLSVNGQIYYYSYCRRFEK